MDLNKASIRLLNYRKLTHSNFFKAMEPAALNEALEAAAVIMSYFRVLPMLETQNALYDTYKQVGHTLNQYYNETVDFLLDSKRRRSGHQFYESLFASYNQSMANTKSYKEGVAIGTTMLNAMVGSRGVMTNHGQSHQTLDVDKRLLSYADHELLALWITRKGGFIDMIETLSIFLKIARP